MVDWMAEMSGTWWAVQKADSRVDSMAAMMECYWADPTAVKKVARMDDSKAGSLVDRMAAK